MIEDKLCVLNLNPGGRMLGADESTELWRHPHFLDTLINNLQFLMTVLES